MPESTKENYKSSSDVNATMENLLLKLNLPRYDETQ